MADLGSKMQKYVSMAREEDSFDDSFSFLKPKGEPSFGEKVMWEVFGKKQTVNGLKEKEVDGKVYA